MNLMGEFVREDVGPKVLHIARQCNAAGRVSASLPLEVIRKPAVKSAATFQRFIKRHLPDELVKRENIVCSLFFLEQRQIGPQGLDRQADDLLHFWIQISIVNEDVS